MRLIEKRSLLCRVTAPLLPKERCLDADDWADSASLNTSVNTPAAMPLLKAAPASSSESRLSGTTRRSSSATRSFQSIETFLSICRHVDTEASASNAVGLGSRLDIAGHPVDRKCHRSLS